MADEAGRVDSMFDSCLQDTSSNPAKSGHCVTTVGKLFTPTVRSGAESINQFICHTQTQLTSNIKMSNTFMLCVTGSIQGAYAPHKRAAHVQ